jgi:hypothetical protein
MLPDTISELSLVIVENGELGQDLRKTKTLSSPRLNDYAVSGDLRK